MRSELISLSDYTTLCERSDVGPNYHPRFAEYYFSKLGVPPRILGKYDRQGRLVAAFPTHSLQVFPNALHRRLLGKAFWRLGDIGQPESLFPVVESHEPVPLNRFSPTTSGLLAGKVRSLWGRSLKAVDIVQDRKHKKRTTEQHAFFNSGGRAHFTTELEARDFADLYIRMHSQRWGFAIDNLRPVREQIIALYGHVFGVVLEIAGEPVAAQLCFKTVGSSLYYIDFINSGVRLQSLDHRRASYGRVMILSCLRRAEEEARALSWRLRFVFGYHYGPHTYKAEWTEPEPTFIAY